MVVLTAWTGAAIVVPMYLPNPVIIVPGITATKLRDDYPLPSEMVWTVLSKQYERIMLHPDNRQFEALEPARVQPGDVFEVVYQELVAELRYNLTADPIYPVPVYLFPYDWRMPLKQTVQRLKEFVHEVIERTLLMRHYHERIDYSSNPRVSLVGHSMGGLVIAGYLAATQRESRVSQVVSLATPFHGSIEAVLQIATGTADLGTGQQSSRDREAARLTPALYHLLPDEHLPLDLPPYLAGRTLYDSRLWQRGVIETLAMTIKRHGLGHGLEPKDSHELLMPQAERLLEILLSEAREFHSTIDERLLEVCGLEQSDWLAIAGVNAKTHITLSIEQFGDRPRFNLQSSRRENAWAQKQPPGVRMATGDGTVPLASAIPPFLDRNQVVCVRPEDYGYWEVQDRVVSAASGFHGILPNMNMLHRLLVRFLSRGERASGEVWGCAVPGVLDWSPPIPGLERKDRPDLT